MTFSLTTKLTVGLLVALAPAAFWAIDTRYIASTANATAVRAEEKADKALELREDLVEIKTDVKWIIRTLKQQRR